MASLLCGPRGGVSGGGAAGTPLLVWSGLKFVALRTEVGAGSSDASAPKIYTIPDPLPASSSGENKKPPQPESTDPLRILCGDVSSCGSLLTLCDDHKQMTLWRRQLTGKAADDDEWHLVKQWNLEKRANKVVFHDKAGKILTADKSGDVYTHSMDVDSGDGACDSDGKVLLGHLSMLLDVLVSSCGRFVLTCDRDEKIRVSHFPNAYNIHNFCLGHTEFVTGMELVDRPSRSNEEKQQQQLLISSSGDGTLRVWDYLSGSEVGQRLCNEDAGMALRQEVAADADDQGGKEEEESKGDKNGQQQQEDLRVKKCQAPAVKKFQVLPIEGKATLVVAVIDGFPGALVYALEADSSSPADASQFKLTLVQKLDLKSELWDFGVDRASSRLWTVEEEGDYVSSYLWQEEGTAGQFRRDEAFSLKKMAPSVDWEELFEVAKRSPPRLNELYKRWFDNVKEYMDRKQERLEGDSNGGRNKKRKKNN